MNYRHPIHQWNGRH